MPGPEAFRVLLGLLVELLVFGQTLDMRLGTKILGGLEYTLFVEHGVDIVGSHKCQLEVYC